MASRNFMRLSLMKAAHVALVSASSRKSGSPVFINPRTLVRTWGTRSELVRAEEWFTRTPFQSWGEWKSGLPGRWPWAADSSACPGPGPVGGTTGYTGEAARLQLQSFLCYPRRMADSSRNDMLFSSGDSPNSLSDPFGGRARRRNKESRCSSSLLCGSQQMNNLCLPSFS
jgi:hypothetical protein